MPFRKIEPGEIAENPFSLIGGRLMLHTAGEAGRFNTMTCGWGGLGVLWRMNVAACFVRPQRYTFEFMEKSEYYTLSFYGPEYRPQLMLCGSESGRDTDKAARCGFTPVYASCGAPYFAEAELVLACRKLYASDFDPAGFLDGRIDACYPQKDYHRVYIGELIEVLKKEG
jgi:flavin reductase (DIM6/NTAB) family NADH-FMN oxidoreductase RutF